MVCFRKLLWCVRLGLTIFFRTSLVADVGGLLGLFLGFSVIAIWDGVVWVSHPIQLQIVGWSCWTIIMDFGSKLTERQCTFQVQESWPRLGNKMACVERPSGDHQTIEVTPSKDDNI